MVSSDDATRAEENPSANLSDGRGDRIFGKGRGTSKGDKGCGGANSSGKTYGKPASSHSQKGAKGSQWGTSKGWASSGRGWAARSAG
jgi:hypothetical protein